MDTKELEQIITILRTNGITEFELKRGDVHVKLSREMLNPAGIGVASIPVQPAVSPTIPVASAVSAVQVPSANGNGAADSSHGADLFTNCVKVESPIVGTFYSKPSPDAAPFVKAGDRVEKGDTLCIVEAMKLMNEIEAPRSGTVEKVFLSDGKVVEFGEVLFLINPN